MKYNLKFESSVISFGSKTKLYIDISSEEFESSVISFGSKTFYAAEFGPFKFESSVISFGSKTILPAGVLRNGLRVV